MPKTSATFNIQINMIVMKTLEIVKKKDRLAIK
jgi:hypothetical protein